VGLKSARASVRRAQAGNLVMRAEPGRHESPAAGIFLSIWNLFQI
jgi:hypothetical protein